VSFDEIVHCLSAEDQKTVREMTALFESIGRQTRQFAAETGLKCETGCGTCCANPDIETTVAEVLPLAVYLWSISQADDALRTRPSAGACVFYKPDPAVKGHGRCGIYAYRPGLCRLFGFAANRDKYGRRTLATCKVIRESQAQACAQAQAKLLNGLHAPVLTAHAFNVANIDPVQGQKLLPINEAVRLGVEKIGYALEKLKQ
jgi:Fe-S-cluster containining protein